MRHLPLVILASISWTAAAHAAPVRYEGTTEQQAPVTLSVTGTSVGYRFEFKAVCGGDPLRPAIVTGARCAKGDLRERHRTLPESAGVPCAAARAAATRWAKRCHASQWLGGRRACGFSSGGRTWRANLRVVGPPGSGGYSRITLRSGSARVTFYATGARRARPPGPSDEPP